jgi:nucleotide-binding universal stress UspA family protein
MGMSKIIVGVEGEREGRDAVALGAALARALDASLILCGVSSELFAPAAYGHELAARPVVEDRLAAAAALVPDDVAHEVHVVASTSAVRGLHEVADRVHAELIVVGPTHHAAAARLFVGDLTLGLLQAAPCAVAVAPAGYADAVRGRSHVVGVAYVPTPEGAEALAVGIDIAQRLDAGLRLLYAGQVGEASERLLEEARGTAPAGTSVETVLLDGITPVELLRSASEDLELLVIGSRGYGPTRRVLLGSVSAGVVHHAACPVLVLPRGAVVPVAA